MTLFVNGSAEQDAKVSSARKARRELAARLGVDADRETPYDGGMPFGLGHPWLLIERQQNIIENLLIRVEALEREADGR